MKRFKKNLCLLLVLALCATGLSFSGSGAAAQERPSTASEMLEFYRAAVNKVRGGDAGYDKIMWQSMPALNLTGVAAVDNVLKLVAERYITPEDDARAQHFEQGSGDAKQQMPACTLNDLSNIKEASCLMNGKNYALKLVLAEERDPASKESCMLGQITDLLFTRTEIDRELTNLPVISESDYDLIYKSFTVTAEITPAGEFVSLTHHAEVEIVMNSVKIITTIKDKTVELTADEHFYGFGYGNGAPSEQEYLAGDVSLDGSVTAEDARLALRVAVGLESFAAGSAQMKAADFDGNGSVTAADARSILRLAVGLDPFDSSEEPTPPEEPEKPLPQPSAETVALAEKYRAAIEKTRALQAGYSTLTWQNVPDLNVTGNPTVDGFINNEASKYIHDADRPEGWTYEKQTDAAAAHFPPFSLTDYSRILSAKSGQKDGNEVVTLVMADETDPRGGDSFLGQVTDDIIFREDLDAGLAGISVIGANPDYHVTYKNLTLTAEIAPDGTLVRMHHYVQAEIRVNSALLLVVPLQNKLVTMESEIVYYDFTY